MLFGAPKAHRRRAYCCVINQSRRSIPSNEEVDAIRQVHQVHPVHQVNEIDEVHQVNQVHEVNQVQWRKRKTEV